MTSMTEEVREFSRAWRRAVLERQAEAGKLVYTGLGQIGQACGASKKTLYKWIDRRGFPAFKLDGHWRATPAAILEWMDQQRAEARARKDEE